MRILRKKASETTFEEKLKKKKGLMDGGYPQTLIEDLLSEIKFTKTSLNSENKTYKEEKEILPFVTQYQPSVSTIKEA